MLRQFKRNGILICLATGRPPASLLKIDGVEFDAYLTYNGSVCYTSQDIVFSNPIPASDVHKVIRNAAELGRPVSVDTKERLAANGIDADLAEYDSFAHLKLTVADDLEKAACQEVYQVMLGCREQNSPAILKGVLGARINASGDRAADIIPANSGKGTGMSGYDGIDRACYGASVYLRKHPLGKPGVFIGAFFSAIPGLTVMLCIEIDPPAGFGRRIFIDGRDSLCYHSY